MSHPLATGLEVLVEALRRIGAGEAGVRSNPNDLPDELGSLARALNDMSEAVDERCRETELAADNLRALAGRVESLREEERSAIAIEIHDQIGQALTALKLDLAWLERKLRADPAADPARLRERITVMMDLVDGTADRVHNLAMELRPDVLDRLGLPAAIEWQAQQFQQRTGLETRVTTDVAAPLDPQRSTAMFRIAQEALTNVARHAAARTVRISLTVDDRDVTLEIADDGRGPDPARSTSLPRLGLLGMRERARAFGGDVTIDAAAGTGTVVVARLPAGPSDS
jgi:signal transduction histidine kinase